MTAAAATYVNWSAGRGAGAARRRDRDVRPCPRPARRGRGDLGRAVDRERPSRWSPPNLTALAPAEVGAGDRHARAAAVGPASPG